MKISSQVFRQVGAHTVVRISPKEANDLLDGRCSVTSYVDQKTQAFREELQTWLDEQGMTGTL